MPNTRSDAFDRVTVDYLVRGGATVRWALRDGFRDPEPHDFQLQVRRDGGEAWEDLGAATQTFFGTDPLQRLYGSDRRLEYRVRLTTPLGTHDSPPARPLGNLERRAWLAAREILRRAGTAVRQKGLKTFVGHLLKRKYSLPCTLCVDPDTGDTVRSDCPACASTGYVDGYWRAVENAMVELTPHSEDREVDPEQGTVDQDRLRQGVFLGPLLPEPRDVWVEAGSDRRYAVGRVSVKSELGGVPLVVAAELRELEHTDPVYKVSL